jgi:hypothetical protein
MEENLRRLVEEIKKSNELTLFFSKLWRRFSFVYTLLPTQRTTVSF